MVRSGGGWGRKTLAVCLGTGLAVGAGVGVASAGATVSPTPQVSHSVVPALQESGSGVDPLHQFRRQRLSWGTCSAGMLQGQDAVKGQVCALLRVPLNYRDPNGKTIKVAVGRLRAGTDRGVRPVLMMNPGGPGGGAIDMVGQFRDQAPQAVTNRYDLVGMNPRGLTGGSQPLQCMGTMTAGEIDMAFSTLNAYRPAAFPARVKAARGIADKCGKKIGPDLAHYTTANTARDMDVLRSVLGVPKISYLGVSYGTYLGAVYAQLFPDRSDRFVLDSTLDPETFASPGWMRDYAPQAEQAFTHWTAWAATHDNTYHLGKTPTAVRSSFYAIVKQMGPDSGGSMRQTMRRSVYDVKRASEYVVEHRNDTAETLPWMPPSGPDETINPIDSAIKALYYTVVCGESRGWPTNPGDYRQAALEAKKKFPLAGDIANDITPCAFWPYQSAEAPIAVSNSVPLLMIHNQWDGQTPLPGAQAARRLLHGSRMVTVKNGQGHGIYLENGNTCARTHVSSYFITGQLPTTDLTCTAPIPQP